MMMIEWWLLPMYHDDHDDNVNRSDDDDQVFQSWGSRGHCNEADWHFFRGSANVHWDIELQHDPGRPLTILQPRTQVFISFLLWMCSWGYPWMITNHDDLTMITKSNRTRWSYICEKPLDKTIIINDTLQFDQMVMVVRYFQENLTHDIISISICMAHTCRWCS